MNSWSEISVVDKVILIFGFIWIAGSFMIFLSAWWDVLYIRKNHDKTSVLLFGKEHEFSTGEHKIGWIEGFYFYGVGFLLALHFNRFPNRADKIRERATKKGHVDYILWPTITKNENYKKIVELNPKLMKLVRIRLWGMVVVVVSAAIVINI